MSAPWLLGWCIAVGALACAPLATAGPGCEPIVAPIELTRDLRETSGVAVSRRDAGLLWTHNDGDSDLWALGRDGTVLERFQLPSRVRDWEDLEIAPCAVADSCIYVADTGDNGERRRPGQVRILRVPEPSLRSDGGGGTALEADVFPVRLPDGPRDIEALFVLPGEQLFLVSKGANHPVTVYRYPLPLRPDTVTLEVVQQLTDGPEQLLNRVTGASASPDGRWVGIRTYQALRFYRVRDARLVAVEGGLVNLRPLREMQGEAIGIGADGFVALTSEGGPLGGPPSLRLLQCRLEGA